MAGWRIAWVKVCGIQRMNPGLIPIKVFRDSECTGPPDLHLFFQPDRLLKQPVIIPDDSNARIAALVPKQLRNHKVTASNSNEPA